MDKPLEGIRVVEVSTFLAGPACGVMLARFGAEVIKVEQPGVGDPSRGYEPFAGPHGVGAKRSDDDLSYYILKRARGKKGITLNLKTQRGRELLLALVRKSDIVLENLQPGTMGKLGLGYEDARAVNPSIIYCSVSGFGQTGPYRNKVAFDPIIQAMSGAMFLNGHVEAPPVKAGFLLADTVAPIYAAVSILAALRARDRTGQGQYIDVAMLDCLLGFLFEDVPDYNHGLGRPLRHGNRVQGNSPSQCYETKDGHVYLSAATDQQFSAVLRVIGAAHEIGNPDLTGRRPRWDHRDIIDAMVSPWIRERTTAEVVAIMDEYEVPCGPVNTIADILADPHIAERGTLEHMRHPLLEEPLPGLVARFPARFSGFDTDCGPAPKLGMHNDEVLGNLLGLTPEERADLSAQDVT